MRAVPHRLLAPLELTQQFKQLLRYLALDLQTRREAAPESDTQILDVSILSHRCSPWMTNAARTQAFLRGTRIANACYAGGGHHHGDDR
jgi:hypothetical protein